MGGRQGGGGLFDQPQGAGAEGPGTGAAFRLDDVGPRGGQVQGQLLLLV